MTDNDSQRRAGSSRTRQRIPSGALGMRSITLSVITCRLASLAGRKRNPEAAKTFRADGCLAILRWNAALLHLIRRNDSSPGFCEWNRCERLVFVGVGARAWSMMAAAAFT